MDHPVYFWWQENDYRIAMSIPYILTGIKISEHWQRFIRSAPNCSSNGSVESVHSSGTIMANIPRSVPLYFYNKPTYTVYAAQNLKKGKRVYFKWRRFLKIRVSRAFRRLRKKVTCRSNLTRKKLKYSNSASIRVSEGPVLRSFINIQSMLLRKKIFYSSAMRNKKENKKRSGAGNNTIRIGTTTFPLTRRKLYINRQQLSTIWWIVSLNWQLYKWNLSRSLSKLHEQWKQFETFRNSTTADGFLFNERAFKR